jgi:hypothetical protein
MRMWFLFLGVDEVKRLRIQVRDIHGLLPGDFGGWVQCPATAICYERKILIRSRTAIMMMASMMIAILRAPFRWISPFRENELALAKLNLQYLQVSAC